MTECPICYESMIQKQTLPCTHEFCLDCLETWKKEKHHCPLCRDILYPKVVFSTRRNHYGDNIESVQQFWVNFKQTDRFLNFIAKSFLLFQQLYPVSFIMLQFFYFIRENLLHIIEKQYNHFVEYGDIIRYVKKKSEKEVKELLWEKTKMMIESFKESPKFQKSKTQIGQEILLHDQNKSTFQHVKVEVEELDNFIEEKIEHYTSQYWRSFFGCHCVCCEEESSITTFQEPSLDESCTTPTLDTQEISTVEDREISDDAESDEEDDENSFDFEDYHFTLFEKIFKTTLENQNVIEYAKSENYVQDLLWIVNCLLKYPYYGGYIHDDESDFFALENDFIYQFFQDQKTLIYSILSVFHPKEKKINETLNQFYDITKMHIGKYFTTQETNTWRDFFEHFFDEQNKAQIPQGQTQGQIQNILVER